MSEKMRESLSALMDNEANELELQRILANIDDNEDLRETWTRYNAARDALDGHSNSAFMHMDVSRQVQAAIADEGPLQADGAEETTGLRERLLRPVASFAIAASVATVAVIGGQQLSIGDGGVETPAAPSVATVATAPVVLDGRVAPQVASFSGDNAPSPVLQQLTPTAAQAMARHRTNRIIEAHAEHAALNTPHGLVPYARFLKNEASGE